MTGDLPAAAVRLMSSCPVRTHVRTPQAYAERLSVNNFRNVIVDGVRYESLTEAGRQLGRSRGAIRNMIARGEACYAR